MVERRTVPASGPTRCEVTYDFTRNEVLIPGMSLGPVTAPCGIQISISRETRKEHYPLTVNGLGLLCSKCFTQCVTCYHENSRDHCACFKRPKQPRVRPDELVITSFSQSVLRLVDSHIHVVANLVVTIIPSQALRSS